MDSRLTRSLSDVLQLLKDAHTGTACRLANEEVRSLMHQLLLLYYRGFYSLQPSDCSYPMTRAFPEIRPCIELGQSILFQWAQPPKPCIYLHQLHSVSICQSAGFCTTCGICQAWIAGCRAVSGLGGAHCNWEQLIFVLMWELFSKVSSGCYVCFFDAISCYFFSHHAIK